MLKKKTSPLLLVVLLALVLRILGINHGFPFIFHPDEPAIIREALGLRFKTNPGHFDWPHLYLYLNYFVYIIFAKVRDIITAQGYKAVVETYMPIMWNDRLVFYLLTRIISAIFGALTVIPVYLSGQKLFNKRVGIFSALIFALLPFHVWHSHYALADVPMVFMLSWSLYFSIGILYERNVRNYLLAGLFSGFAASLKYNGGFIALAVPLAHLFRILTKREEKLLNFDGLMNLVFSGVCSVAGFLIGTPYALLDFKTFKRTDGPQGALWQFTNVGANNSESGFISFFENMFYRVSDDVGYVPLVLFLGSLFFLIYRLILKKRKQNDYKLWFLIIPGIVFLYIISGFSNTRSHYFMTAYPFITIVTGYVFDWVFIKVKSNYINYLILLLLLLPLILQSSQSAYTFYREDTRVILIDWVKINGLESATFIHDSTTIGRVLKTVAVDVKHGYDHLSNLKNPDETYIIAAPYEVSPNEVFERYTYLPKMDFLYEIDNTYRRGPNIAIYKSNLE